MLKIEPDHIPARSLLLSYAAQRDDVEEMVSICSEGIDYSPEVLEFYYYKGIGLCYFMGRPDEGLETLRQATRQIGEGSDVEMASNIYSTLGNLLQDRGEADEAITYYETALQYTPSDVLLLNNYAYLLAQEGNDLEKAEQMSRKAIEAEPNNATYLDTYAWVLYKLKRYKEALTYIEQALSNDTQPSDVLYEHAGDISLRAGHKAKALDYWRKALDLQRSTGTVDKELKKKIKTNK
jgi:tetratricopeptide (TPR) repeat protein